MNGRGAREAVRSTGSWALLTKGHAGQLFLEPFLIFRVAGMRQALGQLEEAFPFPLPSFDTRLDEMNNDAVGARDAGLRQGFHLFLDLFQKVCYDYDDQIFRNHTKDASFQVQG